MLVPATPTSEPAIEKPPRRRRWIPLSLRIFAVILVLVTLCSCWQICLRHVAIQEIERTGGTIVDARPRGPQWLRDRLGHDWSRVLDQVVQVQLGAQASDATLADLTALSEVEILWLADSRRVTDSGLVHFRKMPNLGELGLPPNVTDAGLRHLSAMTALRDLSLNRAQITDVGLTHLKNLSRLRGLHLSGTKVTDAGVAQLTGMVNLDWLDLAHTRVTNAGLEFLQALPVLRGLDLSGTRVTDSGLICLKRFPRLNRGRLPGDWPCLVRLDDTLITYEAYLDLAASMPEAGFTHLAYFQEEHRRKVEQMQFKLGQAPEPAPR
jgi:hypothetical protein